MSRIARFVHTIPCHTLACCTAPNIPASLSHRFVPQSQFRSFSSPGKMSQIIPRDVQEFLRGYPGQSDSGSTANLDFYRNLKPCEPDGLLYEDFIAKYGNDFEELEMNHGFIQWFFPIREHGVNPLARPLQLSEIWRMQADPEVTNRLLRSYKMMLEFYGIDYNEGNLRQSRDSTERFRNLSRHTHNLLRVTRIIKHLSEFPTLQPNAAPLILFFASQHSEGRIDFGSSTMHGESMDRWWSNCFRDEGEREEVRGIVKRRGRFGEGLFGRQEFEDWLKGRQGR